MSGLLKCVLFSDDSTFFCSGENIKYVGDDIDKIYENVGLVSTK